MITTNHPFYATATEIAKKAVPFDFHQMKSLGLNLANRRRLASLTAKGKLSASDLPVWLVARIHIIGTN